MAETTVQTERNTLNADLPSEASLSGTNAPNGRKTLTRVFVVILIVVLLLAVGAVVWMLIPRPSAAGSLAIVVGEETTTVQGEDVLRNFNGAVTEYTCTQPADVANAPEITYAEDMQILLQGVLRPDSEDVTVYNQDFTVLFDGQKSLSVPAEAGRYLVRFEFLWGSENNYVSTQYYIWLNVLTDAPVAEQ